MRALVRLHQSDVFGSVCDSLLSLEEHGAGRGTEWSQPGCDNGNAPKGCADGLQLSVTLLLAADQVVDTVSQFWTLEARD
jgi:hypothetical protein